MKDKIDLRIRPDGTIETIYQDGLEEFARDIGAEISQVCRLSNVEWEKVQDGDIQVSGWTVRSARDPEYALRYFNASTHMTVRPSKEGTIAVFIDREEALRWEAQYVWELKGEV